jgi:hypothetical protein
VVLLSGVGQVQELAECACNRQQLIVGQVLQRGEQLLTIGFIASTEDLDSLRMVSTRSRMFSPNASLMVSPSTLPSILTLLRNAEYCSFMLTQTPHLILFCYIPVENLDNICHLFYKAT